jgi:hypothetical protein
MPTKRKPTAQDAHYGEFERRYNVIDQKLDAIAHVRVNGSIGLEPALKTIFDTAKDAHKKIEEIKEETQLMRDLHKLYLIYRKYVVARLTLKVVLVILVGQLIGVSVKELISLVK